MHTDKPAVRITMGLLWTQKPLSISEESSKFIAAKSINSTQVKIFDDFKATSCSTVISSGVQKSCVKY